MTNGKPGMLTEAERAALLRGEGEIDAALAPICIMCEEPVLPGEAHKNHTPPAHYECVMRSIFGSVAHLQRRCSCYAEGSTAEDPPGLSKRDAARAAVTLFRALEDLGVDVFAERRLR